MTNLGLINVFLTSKLGSNILVIVVTYNREFQKGTWRKILGGVRIEIYTYMIACTSYLCLLLINVELFAFVKKYPFFQNFHSV